MTKRRILEYGGVAAGVVMIAIGLVSLVLAINGRSLRRSGSRFRSGGANGKRSVIIFLASSLWIPATSTVATWARE